MSSFFSVIIPTLNSGKTISSAIESILLQSYTNIEVLIMDGLSTDDTETLVKGFNDERVQFYGEKDTGVYDAMNRGIKLAKGEWVYFLGSDDVLYDATVLDDVYKLATAKAGLDVIYGDAILKSSKAKYYGRSSLERLMLESNICHQAIFYSRSVFAKLGNYNLQYKVYADWDFNIRCFMHPDFCIEYLDRVICLYNDIDGLSNKLGDPDLKFLNLVPVYLVNEQKKNFIHSVDYRLSQIVLRPYRLVKSLLSRN
jgi:glycosyltransferase involved in cell wall biosynthesis